MEEVQMIAVIYHDVNQVKGLTMVKNAEEFNKLNPYYVDDITSLNCYTYADVLLLNMQDEALLQFLMRNDENGNIMIPYCCFKKELQCNNVDDYKEAVDIFAPYPLFHEEFILMEGPKRHVLLSFDELLMFLSQRTTVDDFKLLKEKRAHIA